MSLRTAVTAPATVVLAALVLVGATQSPAGAQPLAVPDAAGDAVGTGMDITSVKFRNRDHMVVVRLAFVEDRPSDVIVFLRERGRGAAKAIIISEHRRRGPDSVRGGDADSPCRGVSGESDRDAATMTLRFPARCLADGNYGALRAWALVEPRPGGGDTDWAPEQPDGSIALTEPIPRG